MDESLLRTISEVEHDHWWFVVRRRIVTDALERLPLPADADVVEVGCGSGGTLAHLAKRHPRWKVTGVEPSRAVADVARSRGCTVLEGALPHLDLEDGCADCVIALDVLEHCAHDVAAAREMARVLR
ncbi:MAG: class I SAM-dependent methyltransferase, partial [Coriobacteriia bacterium]|nr:class I SAM-dependent methyltransferase [Coriobacteriia bacterium]